MFLGQKTKNQNFHHIRQTKAPMNTKNSTHVNGLIWNKWPVFVFVFLWFMTSKNDHIYKILRRNVVYV